MSGTQGNVPGTKRPGAAAKPFSIRLTEDERCLLLGLAGNEPLGTYIRNQIFSEGVQIPRKVMRRAPAPVKDHEVLARVLSALGHSRIANNLNQLAKAVNIGALPVSPEVEEDITGACAAIVAMRRDLMHALGLKSGDGS